MYLYRYIFQPQSACPAGLLLLGYLAVTHPAGVSKAELLKIMKSIRFTPAEQKQLTAATKQAAEVFGYAGGH